MKYIVCLFILTLAMARQSSAALVTFTLQINPGTNTWQLFGTASAGDNAGIALWSVSLNNVTDVDIEAPYIIYNPPVTILGLHNPPFESSDNPIGSAQNTFGSNPLVYGFGQTSGTLVAPGGTTIIESRNPTYDAFLLLASDTYSGAAPSFFDPEDPENEFAHSANVFEFVNDTSPVAAQLAFQTQFVPEPAAGLAAVASLFGLIRRHRR